VSAQAFSIEKDDSAAKVDKDDKIKILASAIEVDENIIKPDSNQCNPNIEQRTGTVSSREKLRLAHYAMRPFILRRIKSEVEQRLLVALIRFTLSLSIYTYIMLYHANNVSLHCIYLYIHSLLLSSL